MTLSFPEPLDDYHIIDEFDSGTISLDDWLKRRARTNQTSGASRIFVVCKDKYVVAYYSLASSSISCTEAVGRFRRNMPNPTPVITLARLTVDRSWQAKGIGRALVRDAAKRVIAAADLVGIRGMIVHGINEDTKAFYLNLGFLPSPANELTLMISLTELSASL